MARNKRKSRTVVYGAILILLCFSIAVSQSETKQAISRPMVRLNMVVADKHNQPARDMLKEDVVITDSGEQQSIAYFAREETTVSYGLLIDASGSLKRVAPTEAAIAQAIVNSNKPEDRAFVIKFAGVKNIQMLQDWSNDKTLLNKANGEFEGKGATAIHDALYLAADHIEKRMQSDNDPKRRYEIILITDGENNDGIVTQGKLVDRLRGLNIQVFILCLLRDNSDTSFWLDAASDHLVDSLTKATGGWTFFPTKDDELQNACDNLIEWMRSQFVIGYYPTKSLGAGMYHKVKVHLTGRSYKEDNKISVRSGYNERAN